RGPRAPPAAVAPTASGAPVLMGFGGAQGFVPGTRGPPRRLFRFGFIWLSNPVPGVRVLIQRKGSILLARRGHEPLKNAWGIPAGFMEYGEHPEETAVREALEETGLKVRLTGLFGVYAGRDDPRTRAVLILYNARIAGGKLQPGDDAIELGYFPLDHLPRPMAFRAHREALRDLRRMNRERNR